MAIEHCSVTTLPRHPSTLSHDPPTLTTPPPYLSYHTSTHQHTTYTCLVYLTWSRMSSQPVDFAPCGPLGNGQCFFSTNLGQSICNDTGGVIVRSPIDRCDYFICGYSDIEITGNMTTGPLTEGAAVCADGTHSSSASSFKKPNRSIGLWSILLMALTAIPSIVTALPTGHSLARRNATTASFERTANVDWSSDESQ